MGLRLRLKKSFDVSRFPRQSRIVLTALKRYGMIVADNGSDWYVSGAPSAGWNNDDLHSLGGVKGSNFEVVNTSSLPQPGPLTVSPLAAGYECDRVGDRDTCERRAGRRLGRPRGPCGYAHWVVGASRTRKYDRGWPRAGTKFHHTQGFFGIGLPDNTEVVSANRPRQLVLEARIRPFARATRSRCGCGRAGPART